MSKVFLLEKTIYKKPINIILLFYLVQQLQHNEFLMANMKNINHGTINAQTVHIGDITTYVINEQTLKIPVCLTHFIPTNADHVVGRDAELQDTRNKLLTGKPTVLVNGIGGIGKTTLALKYMVAYTPQYQHLAWLNAAAGVQSAFIGNDALLSALHIKEEVEKLVNAAQLDKAFELELF